MDVADVVDSASDGIQQSRTAPGEVLFLGHARHSAQRQAVMDDHALVVKSTIDTQSGRNDVKTYAI